MEPFRRPAPSSVPVRGPVDLELPPPGVRRRARRIADLATRALSSDCRSPMRELARQAERSDRRLASYYSLSTSRRRSYGVRARLPARCRGHRSYPRRSMAPISRARAASGSTSAIPPASLCSGNGAKGGMGDYRAWIFGLHSPFFAFMATFGLRNT